MARPRLLTDDERRARKAAGTRAAYAANPGPRRTAARERMRRTWPARRLAKFGLTPDAYDRMLEEQHGVCAICFKPELSIDRRTGKVRDLSIDHDHRTGRVRGLLCGDCNRALGLLGDDPDRVASAATYLDAASRSRLAG